MEGQYIRTKHKHDMPETPNKEAPRTMAENLGIEFLPDDGDEVRARMPVDHRTSQPWGLLNGGASLALAEILAGHGSLGLCGPGERPCGVQVSGIHVSPAMAGSDVFARARLIHRGASTHVWNVDITTGDGRLVSTARVVNRVSRHA